MLGTSVFAIAMCVWVSVIGSFLVWVSSRNWPDRKRRNFLNLALIGLLVGLILIILSMILTLNPVSIGKGKAPENIATPLQTVPLPAEAVLVSWGDFLSQEHETTGKVEIFRNVDGSYQLSIRDLKTANGPDLHVYLGTDETNMKNGNSIDLGSLIGNSETHHFGLPNSINPNDYSIVSIWCNQYSVPFGYSALVRYK